MIRIAAALLACAVFLNGCAFVDNALLPALAGVPPGNTTVQQSSGELGPPTGTPVGQKVEELHADLTKIEASVSDQERLTQTLKAATKQQSATYSQSVEAIRGKLQSGTTRGNPTLLKYWDSAETQFEASTVSLGQMNKLSSAVASNAARCKYLLQAIQATHSLPGAIDEDARQLKVLEDRVQVVVITIDRLSNDLTESIGRQSSELGEERAELNILSLAIDSGEPLGKSLASRVFAPPMAPALPPGSGAATGRPLVVIRFDRIDVSYQQPLYEAISAALMRRPNAGFDLVAVAPSGGTANAALGLNAALHDGDQVLHALVAMGLTADRVNLSSLVSPEAHSIEVRLYVR
jgi:hypothetical protein